MAQEILKITEKISFSQHELENIIELFEDNQDILSKTFKSFNTTRSKILDTYFRMHDIKEASESFNDEMSLDIYFNYREFELIAAISEEIEEEMIH